MNTLVVVAIVVGVLVVLAIVWAVMQSRRRTRLRERYGSEYEHVVDETGSPRKAASVLEEREERVKELDIRPLEPDEAQAFTAEWTDVQARFVDNPRLATAEADDLVGRVMRARGYPVTDFEQRAADVSVHHPDVVENYRAAHAIAGKAERSQVSTEDLRQALIHYRALFDDLLETRQGTAIRVERVRRAS